MISEKFTTKWDGIIAGLPEESLPVSDSCQTSSHQGDVIIDVLHWISRATFDVIGLAGFDYAFHALEDESEEVYSAYIKMFRSQDKQGFKNIVQLYFPVVEKLWPDNQTRTVNDSLRVIRRRGTELVRNKKKAIMADISSSKDIWDSDLLSLLSEQNTTKRKHLLVLTLPIPLLVKANLSEDPSRRLSDSELLDQLSTFLVSFPAGCNGKHRLLSTMIIQFAGSDTTAVSTAWCLHFLALYPDLQTQLRDELMTCDTSNVDEIDNLPFLNALVQETLRIAPPVHGTIRVAMQNDVIPLSGPLTLRTGETVDSIRIRKGSYVHIPIEGLHYSKDDWGEDALEFRCLHFALLLIASY